jgi:hypothetical protein
MAFPIIATENDIYVEADLKYIRKTLPTRWDLVNEGQELILSVVDPTAGDAATVGTVWRNTATGEAWQREAVKPTSSAGTPVVLANLPYTSGFASNYTATGPTVFRFSFDLDQWTNITKMSVFMKIGNSGDTANGVYDFRIFEGEDLLSATDTPPATLNLGSQIVTSGSKTVALNGVIGIDQFWSATFLPSIIPPGRYTLVVETTTTLSVSVPRTSSNGNGSFSQFPVFQASHILEGVPLLSSVWVPILHQPSVQLGIAVPTTQADGSSLVPGDLWYNTTVGSASLMFWDGTAWIEAKTFYDNTIQNVFVSDDNQSTLDEVDAILDRLESGINFVGSYNPATNQADFTTLSGLTDGTLPADNTVGNSFLVVTIQATGQAPAPIIPLNKGDFLVADPVTNTWFQIPIGRAVDEFTDYLDTPSSYLGAASSFLRVNATETGVEFAVPVDTHSLASATAPTLRQDGSALQVGDQWYDTVTNREKLWDGAMWKEQVYVSQPTLVADGLLWYDTITSSLYIWDATVNQWVAI